MKLPEKTFDIISSAKEKQNLGTQFKEKCQGKNLNLLEDAFTYLMIVSRKKNFQIKKGAFSFIQARLDKRSLDVPI